MQASEGVTKNDKFPSVTERSAALPLTGSCMAGRALHLGTLPESAQMLAGFEMIPQGEPGGD
jgi:hypothetical protein